MPLIRTENAHVLWVEEAEASNPVTTADKYVYGSNTGEVVPTKRFGIHETVSAPDPSMAWYPFYGIGTGRSRGSIFPGPWTLSGGIPDIRLQAIADDDSAPTASLLAMCIGHKTADLTGGRTGYQINENLDDAGNDQRLPTFCMDIVAKDITGGYPFIRRYYGGKVNRWTLSASEGEMLRLSLDEIVFQGIRHNTNANVVGYQSAADGLSFNEAHDPGISCAGQFFYAGATIKFGDATEARPIEDLKTFGRVKRFSISGDNQLLPKRYLRNGGLQQVINELPEGKRSYQMELELDVADSDTDLEMFNFMLNEGRLHGNANVVGYRLIAQFESHQVGDNVTMQIYSRAAIDCNRPGAVVTGGPTNIPPPPAGYWDGRYTVNIDSIAFDIK